MTARRLAIPPQSEARFQADYFVPLFSALGWKGYHTHDSRRSAAGFPDWILVRGRRLIAAELKSEKGEPTPEQAAWLRLLAGAGVEVYVWRPSDKQRIAEILR